MSSDTGIEKTLIKSLQDAQARLDEYKSWDEARRTVINHLRKNHGLDDPYEWANLTIKLLKELEALKFRLVFHTTEKGYAVMTETEEGWIVRDCHGGYAQLTKGSTVHDAYEFLKAFNRHQR